MAYTLSWSKELVVAKLSGVINASTLMAMADEIARDYRFDDLRKRIYDCAEVTYFHLTLHEIKIFIHVDNATYITNPNAHIAIVSSDPSVAENVAIYRQRFAHTPWQLLVFNSLAEAEAWEMHVEHQSGLNLAAQPSKSQCL